MLYLQLAEHQAPLQCHGRILSSAGCYGSSTTQHSEGLRDAGGTIHHLIETYQCFFVNLYHVQFHWDSVVIYPLLSGNHKDYDFYFLWGCAGRRDLVHLDPFPSEFYCCMPLGFFVFGRTIFLCMFSHVFQQEVREGNMGEMDTALFNLPNNPQNPPLLSRLATQEWDLLMLALEGCFSCNAAVFQCRRDQTQADASSQW